MTLLTVWDAKRKSGLRSWWSGGTDVASLCGSGIHCDDHSMLEEKAESRGSMRWLELLHGCTIESIELKNEKCT